MSKKPRKSAISPQIEILPPLSDPAPNALPASPAPDALPNPDARAPVTPPDTPGADMAPPPAPDLILDPDDLPPFLAFTPVPRKTKPHAGINALRQRRFIAYLAGNGSVEISATAVGFSANAFYQLKKAQGAESFSVAWDVAIDMGSRRVLDTLMDHAIHGVPETLIQDGKVILERRKFNTRAMMFIVQQRFPEIYGGNLNLLARPGSSLPHGLQKLKEEWRKEWEEEAATRVAEAQAEEDAAQHSKQATLDRILHKYQAKVREEYYFRETGNAIAADFALRQLTQMEVVLDVGGISMDLIKQHFHTAPHGGPWSTAISRAMEEVRHAAWEQASGEEADGYARNTPRDAAALDGTATGDAPDAPPPARYTRPKLPFYLTEAERAADAAARAKASNSQSDSWRTRLSREQAWEAAGKTESDDPGEEPTFLPRG